MKRNPGDFGPPRDSPEIRVKVQKIVSEFLRKWKRMRGVQRIGVLDTISLRSTK